ncbi:glycoside hydrolase family 5 protein [Mycena rebaudengoi]|nr:glycoside hydrolase family 5 protein [Mycena rebaudengoi]
MHGRTLLLRGVNLSGSSKAPVNRPSYVLDDFWEIPENGGESFIGRPLNIDDGSADVHLARLSGWGFNMLRFPVTWEALEHAGPGKYDHEFMDYTVRVLRKCKQYGFRVYMDPHQDIWSRFTGGSGAPFWTLAACGIDPRNLTATQAAIIHCEYPLAHAPDPASLPAMIWSTNYGRLLSQTVFTLFFAGRDFAPLCVIDGKNIQDYLQSHYIEAMGQLADRIHAAGDLLEDCVIGWDSMNEPASASAWAKPQTVDNWTFGTFGPARDGTVTIDPKGRTIWAAPDTEPGGVHPNSGPCIWAQHGVWDVETGFVMLPQYFRFLSASAAAPGPEPDDPVEFIEDYWKPHFVAFSRRIRTAHPEAILFVQPPVFARPPALDGDVLRGRCAYSGHYYDGLTLVTRHWNWFNADALGLLRGKSRLGPAPSASRCRSSWGCSRPTRRRSAKYPTVIGEIGTPFDMDDKRAYYGDKRGKGIGDYSQQEKALDASLNGADGTNAINYTVWTYCPDSTHEWGDGWNMEDLSLWSPDDMNVPQHSIYRIGTAGASGMTAGYSSDAGLLKKRYDTTSTYPVQSSLSLPTKSAAEQAGWRENPYDFLTHGARAVRAFSRPYPVKLVGKSRHLAFDLPKAHFKLVVLVRAQDRLREGAVDEAEPASEIFVPLVHYANPQILLGGRRSNESTSSLEELQHTRSGSAKASVLVPSSNTSTINLESVPVLHDMTASTSSTSTDVACPDLRVLAEKGKDLVDLDVSVSTGRWAVEGQVLRWWYDVPRTGEPDREYTIEIRRRGGVIASSAVESRWRNGLCPPESCNIM